MPSSISAGYKPVTTKDRVSAVRQINIIDLAESLGLELEHGKSETGSRRGMTLCFCHAEAKPSCAFYEDGRGQDGVGRFHCFGCGASGDVVELVQILLKLNFFDAVEYLEEGEFYALTNTISLPAHNARPVDDWQPIPLNPRGERRIPPFPPSIKFDNYWTYFDGAGRVLTTILRQNMADGRKHYFPLTWGKLSGDIGWHMRHISEPRPLYHLDEIWSRRGVPVIVCEGEKAADAARRMFGPDYLATTWIAGTNAVDKTDWSPLAGKTVIIWPDADEPGLKAAELIREKLNLICPHISTLSADGFAKGYDAADFEAEHGAEKAREWLKSNIVQQHPLLAPPTQQHPIPTPITLRIGMGRH